MPLQVESPEQANVVAAVATPPINWSIGPPGNQTGIHSQLDLGDPIPRGEARRRGVTRPCGCCCEPCVDLINPALEQIHSTSGRRGVGQADLNRVHAEQEYARSADGADPLQHGLDAVMDRLRLCWELTNTAIQLSQTTVHLLQPVGHLSKPDQQRRGLG